MRRIVIAIASTITGLVLLFSWPTSLNKSVGATGASGAGTGGGGTTAAGGTAGTTGGTTAGGTSGGTSGGTAAGGSTAQAASGTFTGASAHTRYGDVAVQITVANGKVTDAQAVAYPDGNGRDQQINSYAIPILNSEAVAAGSAKIQTVSGATFTSEGYVASLQDALTQAGL